MTGSTLASFTVHHPLAISPEANHHTKDAERTFFSVLIYFKKWYDLLV